MRLSHFQRRIGELERRRASVPHVHRAELGWLWTLKDPPEGARIVIDIWERYGHWCQAIERVATSPDDAGGDVAEDSERPEIAAELEANGEAYEMTGFLHVGRFPRGTNLDELPAEQLENFHILVVESFTAKQRPGYFTGRN